jgi:hypothetical protein
MRKVEVTLYTVSQPMTTYGATSGPDGSFVIEGLPAGTYGLSASRSGFVLSRQTKNVVVEAGQKISDLEVKMAPQAVLTGHVTDEDGDAVERAEVKLLSAGHVAHEMEGFPVSMVTTNDLGEFRIAGVAAGQYCLSVEGSGQSMQPPPVHRTGSEQAYLTMYYPGTTDRAAAKSIEVAEGARLHDLDVQLKRARAFRVRGRVIQQEKANNSLMTILQIQPKPPAGNSAMSFGGVSHPVLPDGSFEIGSVFPGSYIVSVLATTNGKMRSAKVEVEVKDQDVEGVVLSFAEGIAIEGEIHALQPPAGFKSESVQVFLHANDGGFGAAQADQTSNAGKFSIQGVGPGRYRVFPGIGDAGYVKTIHYNGRELSDGEFEVQAGDSGGKLEIAVAFDFGEVEGTVQNASGAPAPGASVSLHRDGQQPCLCEKSAAADKQGRFHMKGIAPGEYLAIAKSTDDVADLVGSDDMETVKQKGVKVTVAPSARQTVSLQLLQ